MSIRKDGIVKLMCEMAPGTPQWSVQDAPDQTGRVILITGGNAGIGFETAKALLSKNATVYIGARSLAKGNTAVDELRKTTNNSNVHVIQVDLADLSTIPKAVEQFQRRESKLHVLINNAGVMHPPVEQLTAQGYDLQFGTNVLGHYLLTKLLFPLLESTASSLPPTDPVRILELTSDYALLSPGTGPNLINYETLQDGPARSRISTIDLYSQSKSANILVSNARSRLIENKNMVFISVHPGHIRSELQRYGSKVQNAVGSFLLYPTHMGAINSTWAATVADAHTLNGKYIAPWARVKVPRKDHVDNIEAEDRLIAYLEDQLHLNNLV